MQKESGEDPTCSAVGITLVWKEITMLQSFGDAAYISENIEKTLPADKIKGCTKVYGHHVEQQALLFAFVL